MTQTLRVPVVLLTSLLLMVLTVKFWQPMVASTLSFGAAGEHGQFNRKQAMVPIIRARLADLDWCSTIVTGDSPRDTTVFLAGNLQVVGTTETVNTMELKVEDITIAVATGSSSSSDADGAGLEVDIDAPRPTTRLTLPSCSKIRTPPSLTFLMERATTMEHLHAFVAAMTTAADTTALDALTPGAGTFYHGLQPKELYIELT